MICDKSIFLYYKGAPMNTVIYKTESSIFEFNLPDVKDCLNRIIFGNGIKP